MDFTRLYTYMFTKLLYVGAQRSDRHEAIMGKLLILRYLQFFVCVGQHGLH
jgi:hypothetical protein